MPYKTDKQKLDSPFLDKRVKLLPCQKEMIIYWRNKGLSQRKLAALFNVSRRAIQFIIDPEKLKKNKERRQERGGTKAYYKREKHNEYMKNYRKRKYNILKNK